MLHPLVTQLHFARNEFQRCLDGVSAEDAVQRIGPMNCISWMVGHLASQEQRLWVQLAQQKTVEPRLYEVVGHGQPATTPDWDEMWTVWRNITQTADDYLGTLKAEQTTDHFTFEGKPHWESIGTSLQRNIFHYWFHIGEAHAVRQQLGHKALPQFVGNLSAVKF